MYIPFFKYMYKITLHTIDQCDILDSTPLETYSKKGDYNDFRKIHKPFLL